LCEIRQQQSFKAVSGLSILTKMVSAGRPLHVKIWPKLTHPFKNADLQ